MDIQKVKVWISIAGDYCSFKEVSISVVADITNNIIFEDHDFENDQLFLKYLEEFEFEDYNDYEVCDAVIVDGIYYYNIK